MTEKGLQAELLVALFLTESLIREGGLCVITILYHSFAYWVIYLSLDWITLYDHVDFGALEVFSSPLFDFCVWSWSTLGERFTGFGLSPSSFRVALINKA